MADDVVMVNEHELERTADGQYHCRRCGVTHERPEPFTMPPPCAGVPV